MQYTLNGENGDRSSDGEDDNGLSSNPLAHPFSNTLYNYGQHTSLPQAWQQASGLAISYPGNALGNGSMGAASRDHKGTTSMYAHDDVLEREMALLEEEDPTLFLDGLIEPAADEELETIMPTESSAGPSTSNGKTHIAQSSTPHATTSVPQTQQAPPQRPPAPASSASHQHHHHGYQPASLSSITGAKDRSLDQLLISFWTHQMDLAEKGTAANGSGSGDGQEHHEEHDEFKTFGLPLARIKKVMKSDPDVKMISAEVPVLLSKACEIFIAELTCRAWLVAESHKRRTLQKSDVASAIGFSDMFDFLIDIVPREEAISKSELGMKRRTARMKEKKEEERKRKRQEELEEAYAYSQAQAKAQAHQAANAKLAMAAAAGTSLAPASAQRPPQVSAQVSSSAAGMPTSHSTYPPQHYPPQNDPRDSGMPAEKRRRED